MHPHSTTVSQALVALLEAYGVETVFGIPGNHTVELYRHLAGSSVRHVTSRHEQGAGFMADGYARATGRPGVCLLISGPGLLNAATAMAQARADSVPMLVITAVTPTHALGMQRGTLHELPDQHATSVTLCRASHTLLHPDNLAEILHQAFTLFAAARPGPVHIEIPIDLMSAPCAAAATRPLPAPPAPHPDAIAEAARRLQQAERPLLLVGGGAVNAGPAVQHLAERLDAPVLNTVNGKGVCPYGHPQAVGGSPSLPSLRRAIADADAVLAVGTELGETDFDLLMAGTPEFPRELIRLDIEAAQLGHNAVASLPLLGDAAAGCRALLDALATGNDSPAAQSRSGDRSYRPSAAGAYTSAAGAYTSAAGAFTSAPGARAAALRAEVAVEPHQHAEMAAFLRAIAEAVPEALLVGDSTRPTYYASWQYECPAPRRYFHSVTGFGTLGYAIPAALGAALAAERPVLCLIGDGGAQFTWNELQTGAEHGLGVPVMVWRNDGYEEIANSMTGAGVDTASTRISAPDFRHGAAAHGCAHHRARDLPSLQALLRDAVTAAAPTVIELHQEDFLSRPSGGWYG